MDIQVTREGKEYVLHAEQTLAGEVEDVFAFFADAHNLERITPTFLKFTVLTPKPIAMGKGTLIDYRLKVRGLPIRWRSRIEAWEPPQRFIDTQVRGPYHLWHHEHCFEPIGDGQIRATDMVRYRPIGGAIINKLFVQRDVTAIFTYRQTVLAELFGEKNLQSALSSG